ncbi:MAG: methylmalonyl-CoA mutase family protein, partial [Candidatus Methylomirabilales bacterium]
QIIAEETGVPSTIDPLGGSYYLETLTDQIEAAARAYLEKIDALGGTLAAVEKNYMQREIADAAYAFQLAKERGERVVVGVNRYRDPQEDPLPIRLHRVDPETEARQIARLKRVKAGRDGPAIARCLRDLQEAARDERANLMPPTLAAVKAYASMGEIVQALKEVFGRYVEAPVF